MATLTLIGALRFPPSAEAQPASVPINISTTFTQRSEDDYVFNSNQTNKPLDSGSITAPRAILIELYSGEASFSFNVSGANPFRLSMNDTPTPTSTDKATWFMYTHNPAALGLWVTSTVPCSFRVFFFG